MKICLAQNQPAKGNVEQNIVEHARMISTAVEQGADAIIFSELSLTGYEPALADQLATTQDDPRFDTFQQISDRDSITIGVGMPTQHDAGVCISMLLFRPNQPRLTYSKQYLHDDEKPYFVERANNPVVNINETRIGVAICYELSVPAHFEKARQGGAEIYIASVAKHARGVKESARRLTDIATAYNMPVLFVNNIGPADDFVGAGTSTIWDQSGNVLGQLGNGVEGLLLFDTATGEAHQI